MTGGETPSRGEASPGADTAHGADTVYGAHASRRAISAMIVVAHGGQSSSTEPTTALQPAVLRMIPVAAAIRRALRG